MRLKWLLASMLISAQLFYALPLTVFADPATSATASQQPTAAQLQQLVSPIALYPDTLVAQILAASTYPTQIVEADRWLDSNKSMSAKQIAQAASQQPWDPSVKSLTAFPSVLDNLNSNLSWTSTLGDAYYNYPQEVLKAVQVMRHKAEQAGSLKTTPQQTVSQQGQTIIIQPANPQVIYVPQYNPTVVYGAPVAAPPGYSSSDLALAGLLGFGAGIAVGALIADSDGWGSSHWGCGWSGGNVTYNHNVYVSNTNVYHHDNWNNTNWNNNHSNWNNTNHLNWNTHPSTWNNNAYNHSNFNNNELNHTNNFNGNHANHPNYANNNFNHNDPGRNDFGGSSWNHSNNAFGGYKPGGNAWANANRGRSSLGGGHFGGHGFGSGGGGFGRFHR
ncbi:MAG TPA: DUF3300 domain-containing protein [Candidatus Binataceae bacterium]|nr:DUF3300 domain-containing protein [Candidatus Binataceae bacterium]